ncbi:feline leukemia virus subgroup C receptor-related protein 2-like [Asbolus verrucosus]|uniref:Feline leukemia virus subgroup C receptor-related protein 2-like n=1 Tax=Asbolus verrucosus TaxID=1661398 RepID=A0A482W7N8_ASBVE|nr:feline leukemia virus subgroup C receptor-related protein 2-like [Asbolus verrucosus]
MDGSETATPVRLYKYRWVILLIFCLYSSINFVQFLQYSIIANITAKYYEVDDMLVDLTGLLFMISFIVFCLPFNYLIERYNLKIIAIVSSGLTTVGNLIKLLSISPNRFYVVLIGQLLCAVGQVFMLSIPSKLASTWFGAEEVSTACAIAILGTQIGVAIGCIFPSNLVKNSDDKDNIESVFRAKPKLPPSQSQVNILDTEKLSIWEIVKAMAKNKDYLLLLAAFGSSNGLYSCFGIMINGVYLKYFPGSEPEIGIICALAVVAGGCFGSVVFGYILDKWHRFKLTSFFIIITSGITYIFVVYTMEEGLKLATYFTIPIFGFFIASTLLVGFEFVTEVMYPIPEAASCSVLNSFIYLFSIMYTLIFNALFDAIGYIPTHAIC